MQTDEIKIIEKSLPSADGVHTLRGVVYMPASTQAGKPAGILQIVHGMTEYIGRYHRFMADMAAAGWLVCGHDHLGHGRTSDPADWGFIARKGGWELLCRDAAAFGEAVRAEYEGQFGRLPLTLMGHSMGSFVARLTAERYVRPGALAGLIVMGTGGPNPAAGAGIALSGLIRALRGERHVSKLLDAMAFGGYNKPFAAEDDPYAWLTNDRGVRDAYRADPMCTFPFTVSAMGDLIRLTKYANRGAWFKNIPADLPILLVSGQNDPVGGIGKGVETVHRRLERAGKDVTCRIYEGARHEILNDACYETVLGDIQDFLAK